MHTISAISWAVYVWSLRARTNKQGGLRFAHLPLGLSCWKVTCAVCISRKW